MSTPAAAGTHAARLGLAGLLLALILALPVAAQDPEGPGVIAGRLTNGTAGGAVPAGAEVVLHAFRGQAQQAARPGRTDEQGTVRLEGLDVGEDLTYQLVAAYAGVAYGSAPFRLTAAAPEHQLEFPVYETTASDPGLRTSRAVLVLAGVDAARQEVAATEIHILTNPSDRTFVPSASGPAGPMGLVRFGLPPGAGDLRTSLALDPERIIQVDRGFASTAPVPPGDHEIGFAYRFPYTGDRLVLEQSFPYGAGVFLVLVPEGGPTVVSPALSPSDPPTFGDRRYRAFLGRDLAPSTRLALEVRALPARPLWRAALELVVRPIVVPALLALVLLVGALRALYRRPRAAAAPPLPVPAREETPPLLFQALADLDDSFLAGRVAEQVYRERRAALKVRLRALLASGDVAEGLLATGMPATTQETGHG